MMRKQTLSQIGIFFFLWLFTFFGSITVSGQNRAVSGTVIDSKTSETIIGASLHVTGTKAGVSTDKNGAFHLDAPAGAKLRVSMIGYEAVEVDADFLKPMVISIRQTSNNLNEVVVQAFQSTTRQKIVNAVTTVNLKSIENLAGYTDLSSALQGRTPGVIITNGSGAPGSTPSISIRGGGAPLYVIDGIVQDQATFNRLNNQDIASVTLLKDGASTAVYGALGGSGVVLVTTKRGTTGKPRINYNFENQLNSPINRLKLISAYDYASAQNEATFLNGGGANNPNSADKLEAIRTGSDPVNNPDTKWEDLFLRKSALTQRQTVSVDGGAENTQYHFSGGYLNQNTLFKPIGGKEIWTFDRYDINASITHNFEKIGLKIGLDLKGSLEDKKGKSEGGLGQLGNRYPYEKAFNPDGTYFANSFALQFDPATGYENINNPQYNSRLNLDWDIPKVKGLSATFWGNYQTTTTSRKTWNNAYVASYNADGTLAPANTPPSLNMRKDVAAKYEINTGLNYKRTFATDHNVSALVIYNQQENTFDWIQAARSNYLSSAVDQLFAGPASSATNDAGAGQGGRLGVVGVLNYDYRSKYIVGATFREDGSDYYQEGKRWGFFPSLSLGWVLSDESFLKKSLRSAKIDFLKLRVSYAKVGIEGSRFAYFTNWPLGNAGFDIGGVRAPIVSTPGLVSPNLTWVDETTKNIGLEINMLNSRLSLQADYFVNDFINYLSPVISVYSTPLGTAFPTVILDDKFRRAGSEFTLSWRDQIGQVKYRVGGNLSFYDEIWVKRNEDPSVSSNPLRTTTYKTIGDGSRTFIADGLYQNAYDLLNSPRATFSQPVRAGDIRYKDVNGDGRIDADVTNGGDYVYNGLPTKPILQYGIDFSVEYKGFSFTGLIQGSGSNYKFFTTNVQANGVGRFRYDFMLDYWTPDHTDARFPIPDPGNGTINNQQTSTYWMVDATYWRIKNLTLGYDFKPLLFKNKTWVSTFKVSAAGQNIFTVSPAKYFLDPEQSNASLTSYPIQKTYSILLSVGF